MEAFHGESFTLLQHNGFYYIFTAEFRGQPLDFNMRIVVLRSRSRHEPFGPFDVVSEIARMDPKLLKVTDFNQTCSGSYCTHKDFGTPARTIFSTEFTCTNPNEKNASPWAPYPVFDAKKNRWKVYSVTYACDFREQVLCGEANIFLYESLVEGFAAGVAGPWTRKNIAVGPSACPKDVEVFKNATRWGSVSHEAEDFVDELSVYDVVSATGRTTSYAAFAGAAHFLAVSDDLSGPWRVTNTSFKDAI